MYNTSTRSSVLKESESKTKELRVQHCNYVSMWGVVIKNKRISTE